MLILLSTQPQAPTEALKAAVERNVNKLVNSDKLTRAEVYMTSDKHEHQTKIRLHGKHLDLIAKAKDGNMYKALAMAMKKIKRQLSNQKR